MSTKTCSVTQNQYDILRSIKSGNTIAETATELNVPYTTARNRVHALKDMGLIKANGTSRTGSRGRPASIFSVSADLRKMRPRSTS